jgi:predicted esterase
MLDGTAALGALNDSEPAPANGLQATYFDGPDFAGPGVSRIDPQVDFAWNGYRAHPRIDTTTFSVRWEGLVEAPVTGDYTFFSQTDDGSRLWVSEAPMTGDASGAPLLDFWGNQDGSTEHASDSFRMVAGHRYGIRFEYFQNQGDASAHLRWGGPVPYGVIPSSQLFPTSATEARPAPVEVVSEEASLDSAAPVVSPVSEVEVPEQQAPVLAESAGEAPAPVLESSAAEVVTGSVGDGVKTIPYRLYKPVGVSAEQKAPLILFLHGMGERGSDNVLQTTWIKNLVDATRGGPYAAYVLAPQIDSGMWFQSYSSSPTEAMKLTIRAVKQVMASENVDPSRVYVTGLSMGGMGTWDILRWEPDLFAAAVPMSGGADPKTAAAIKDIAVWAFHGSNDDIVPASATRDMIAALRAAGGSPKYTEVAGGGHVIWDSVYADTDHSLYAWLFAQRRV